MTVEYVVYGGELSLFTRKLEAALHFYGAPFRREAKTPNNAREIEHRSGTHQIPVLHTPENWMIADTTPLLMMLDGRFPARAMFPQGALGGLVHILEEFLDEWVARVMVHYRWHYPESATFAAQRISLGDLEAAERIAAWGPRACRATGTESSHQQAEAEREYEALLAAAQAQLQNTAFLLGDRPTAVDCMVLGGLRAHTYMDPVPKRVVADFPIVVDWLEQRADRWDGGGELAPFPESTPFAQHLLELMPRTYVPFVLANRDSEAAGAKACQATIYEENVSFLSRPYPERSRRMVVDRVRNLASREFDGWLEERGLAGVFA